MTLSQIVWAQVPSTKELLGFEPGQDGRLASYAEIVDAMKKMAAASDRVITEVIGKTTEGRDMLSVIVSDPRNLRRREALVAQNLALADPRGVDRATLDQYVASGKTIVLVNASIHSNEVGPAQASVSTVHFLASTEDPAWLEILNNTIVVFTPCHNPDGYETTIAWWRRFENDPERRGLGLPVLYHKYVGHDNNRDWFMLTQAESRVTAAALHARYRPQIVVDQHQMGARGPRMFVPPFMDPYEPFVHPLLQSQLNHLGRSIMEGMGEQGLTGVVCNRMFDAWSPSRAFQHTHGGVRVLTEVASVNVADPIERVPPLRGAQGEKSPDHSHPWPGGRWTLKDIVTYTQAGALFSIKHASDHRATWLRSFLEIHQDFTSAAIGPAGFVIPKSGIDALTEERLIDLFRLGLVELHQTTEATKHEGQDIPAGSLLIPNGQPHFGFAASLLTPSPYPEIRERPGGPIRRPYDATCHYLPHMMGFKCLSLSGSLPKSSKLSRSVAYPPASRATASFAKADVLLDARQIAAQLDVLRALARGASVERLPKGTPGFPEGAYRVQGDFVLTANGTPTPPNTKGSPVKPRRIGVYWSWLADMDEGWLRFFFDSMGIEHRILRPADVRQGKLNEQVDVVVFGGVRGASLVSGPRDRRLPPEYLGGLGEEGLAALKEFVHGGGTLVTLNQSSDLAISLFDLPLARMGRQADRRADRETPSAPTEGPTGPGLNTPGSALFLKLDPGHPINFGLSGQRAAFINNADIRAWTVGEGGAAAPLRFAAQFPPKDFLASGFGEGLEQIAAGGTVAHAKIGSGHAVLFAFSPHFRCQTWSTFPLLLNALLVGDATEYP